MKEIRIKKITFIPDIKLLIDMQNGTHDLESALSEFIDNSIDAINVENEDNDSFENN